ncbi:MAG: glycosyltransferase family 2 protein [Candidatus Woesebacteria bacterium]|nr:MAG: glycosyltransferase family 2 protein [Candidatus Woesebacteria bacterium]
MYYPKMLSIIILNYNTKDLLKDCILSLVKLKDKTNFEIIVVDNGSVDGSVELVESLKIKNLKIIENKANLGFAKGNNSARSVAKGKYILFLNSDTITKNNCLDFPVNYLEDHRDVGAITCKVILKNGKLDPDTRRSFPTPFVAFTHFSHLDRIFPKSEVFSKYWYGFISDTLSHEIDSLQGAYFLAKKDILDSVNWFDEDYFLDGEDIDLCFKIKDKGYKIVYLPTSEITHLKGATKGKNQNFKTSFKSRLQFLLAGVNSMEIFYTKRLSKNYNFIVNFLVISGINSLKLFRFMRLLVNYI